MVVENPNAAVPATILPNDAPPAAPANVTTAQVEKTREPQPPLDPKEADENNVDSLPEWARKSLNKANTEAASYRTQLREAQEALAKAKSPEDFAKINEQLVAANHKLMIRDHADGLPKEIVEAEWVTWPADENGIKTVAASLRALVANQAAQTPPAQGGELAGGLNPNTNGLKEDLDPDALAKRFSRRSRYSS